MRAHEIQRTVELEIRSCKVQPPLAWRTAFDEAGEASLRLHCEIAGNAQDIPVLWSSVSDASFFLVTGRHVASVYYLWCGLRGFFSICNHCAGYVFPCYVCIGFSSPSPRPAGDQRVAR